MSFNIYLQRAMKSSSPILRGTSKTVHAISGYTDRLLGSSAKRVRTHLDLLNKINSKGKQHYGGFVGPRFHKALQDRHKTLTTRSRNTRIKTGLGLTAAALVARANSSANNAAYEAQSSPNYTYY